MAISSSVVAKVLCMALVTAVVIAPAAEALSCGQVSNSLSSCIGYLRGSGGTVPSGCCSGIKSLNDAAQTSADRKTACNCLKSAAGSLSGIDYGLAAGLPGQCGVSIPYKISPSTDCNR